MASLQYVTFFKGYSVTKDADTAAQPDLHKASPVGFAAVQLGRGAIVKGKAHAKASRAIGQYQTFVTQPDLDRFRRRLERDCGGVLDLRGGGRFDLQLIALGKGRP